LKRRARVTRTVSDRIGWFRCVARVWSWRGDDGTLATTSNEGDVMAMRILWPNLPARLVPVATEAVGSGFELQFHEKFEDVSDEQWATADAVVGGCPPPYIDKL
jgi:hypothetical protein